MIFPLVQWGNPHGYPCEIDAEGTPVAMNHGLLSVMMAAGDAKPLSGLSQAS
jgi:hypothetical protein